MTKDRNTVPGPPGSQDKRPGRLGIGFVVVIALIAFVGGSIITMAVTGPSGPAAPTTPAVSTVLPTPRAQSTNPPKKERPLTDFLSPQEVDDFQQAIQAGQTQGTVQLGATDGSSPSSAIPITSNPNIPNPEPFQYDPVADKYYDPGHSHWHRGKPPAQPSVTDPQPWEFDPATNKFWHPDHNHWHDGQPPPPEQRNQ